MSRFTSLNCLLLFIIIYYIFQPFFTYNDNYGTWGHFYCAVISHKYTFIIICIDYNFPCFPGILGKANICFPNEDSFLYRYLHFLRHICRKAIFRDVCYNAPSQDTTPCFRDKKYQEVQNTYNHSGQVLFNMENFMIMSEINKCTYKIIKFTILS